MRPPVWRPPVELSPAEQTIVTRIRRAKLFVFLRQRRHALFTEAFQTALATIFRDRPKGQPPVPPAQLALVTLLQAYTGASDDEAIEALTMDRRWQLVLDWLDCDIPPFSKATLVRFRHALIAQELDRRLIEQTIDVAQQTGGFSARALRAALDSSPLWGAGRVEDTYHLLGHALRKAVRVIARQQGRELAAVATEARAELVTGSSLKAALDRDWEHPEERQRALEHVLQVLDTVEEWMATPPSGSVAPAAVASLKTAQQVRSQDVEATPQGSGRLRQGVARDRRISLEDAEMRHGRKSRRQRIDGYKRHVLRDLDNGLLRAVGITPANAPEASVTDAIQADLVPQQVRLEELHIDRAYLSSAWVRERLETLTIYCKAWPVRNRGRFPKTAFLLDWEAGTIQCPNAVTIPFTVGSIVRFPVERCTTCPLQVQCTTSSQGRSVSLPSDEQLLCELRERQQSPAGRAKLRERVAVEHALAHVGRWQGPRARYRGQRKNLFALRRTAVVHNLHIILRWSERTKDEAA
jgi:Transposase DDE domain/Transposase domain (DUF772)